MNKTPKLPDIDQVKLAADKFNKSVMASRETRQKMQARLGASNG